MENEMKKSDLLPIVKVLRKAGIPFALAGGYAVAAWGVVRATRDIDFLAAVPPDRFNELLRELRQAGFKAFHRVGDEADPVRGVISLESTKNSDMEPVEIILGIKQMPTGIFERAQPIPFFGMEIPVTSPEDLIVLKCLAGGPVDLEDARAIFAIMKTKLDLKYLKNEFHRCRISVDKLEKR